MHNGAADGQLPKPAEPGSGGPHQLLPETVDAPLLAELLHQVAAGQRSAFDELYLHAFATVYRTTVAIVQDASQAEEVTQETFLEIWRFAGRFDASKGSAAAWIRRVARSRAVDRVRAAQSARVNDHRYAMRELDRDVDTVVEAVLRAADVAALREALKLLTARQREALLMTYFLGVSNRKASDLLGIPLPTLKSRVAEGMASLRRGHEQLD